MKSEIPELRPIPCSLPHAKNQPQHSRKKQSFSCKAEGLKEKLYIHDVQGEGGGAGIYLNAQASDSVPDFACQLLATRKFGNFVLST